MIPITRKDHYLNEIVGWGNTAPEKPLTPEEFFFAAILGEAVQTPEPLSRYQIYLAKIAGRNISVPKPLTRLELFLAKACGMDIETPTPITREEIFWSNYTAIVEFEVEGVPPLTYKAIEGTLENYRIYGNTAGGESVGDRTGNLFDNYPNTITNKEIIYTNVNNQYVTIVGESSGTYSQTGYATYTLPQGTYFLKWYLDNEIYNSNVFMLVRDSNNIDIANVNANGASFTLNNEQEIKIKIVVIQSGVNINTKIYVQINPGSTPLPYEPYGYKVPIALTNSGTTSNETIYLPEPIKMVGDEAEYIDYAEQKMHRIGADDVDVTLHALPTLTGTNVLTVGTAVQPSKVYVKYKGERQ